MTDKQIIIDGVDVSGCNRLNTFPMQYGEPHEICLTSLEQWGGQEKYCKDRPNCYYKQLEKLKAENLGFKILHESDKDLLKRKEQECEKLKETFDGLFKVQYKLADNCKKLRQTLTEIKEIAEKSCCTQPTTTCEEYENCNECGRISNADAVQQILQKISEANNDMENN